MVSPKPGAQEKMKQEEAFLRSEGNAWYARNKDRLGMAPDKVANSIYLTPKSILEFGCADGRRLINLCDRFQCQGYGVDPSEAAITAARQAANGRGDIQFECGIASEAYPYRTFDLIIYGFCLYLCDPESLFKIATLGNHLLADGGHIIIHDFHPQQHHSRVYAHDPNLRSYKMDYSRMFLWHPAYELLQYPFIDDNEDSVTVLRKDLLRAFPLRK